MVQVYDTEAIQGIWRNMVPEYGYSIFRLEKCQRLTLNSVLKTSRPKSLSLGGRPNRAEALPVQHEPVELHRPCGHETFQKRGSFFEDICRITTLTLQACTGKFVC